MYEMHRSSSPDSCQEDADNVKELQQGRHNDKQAQESATTTTSAPRHGFVVWPDGAMSSLMAIEWDEKMVFDHLSSGYREALQSISDVLMESRKSELIEC
ncbi:hypothetical protein ACA910_002880 [Epithemia clementina (nom. ined.)]